MRCYMKVLKVVLTGGPCGGKTTSISAIEENFQEKGYHVIIVPEAATILINSGLRPFGTNSLSMYEFQKYVMKLQLELEDMATKAAAAIDAKTIIVCDRGLLDDKAYVSEEEYQQLIKDFGTTQFDLLNRYDLVLHLKTAADGKAEFYTTSNNGARTETLAEAKEKDQRTLNSWLGHDNLKIIGNDVDFQTKIANVNKAIHEYLKTPYPLQQQEKYLVDYVDMKKLLGMKPVKIDIVQYIRPTEYGEVLYRKSTKEGETKYTKITKIDIPNSADRIVKRKNITENEFFDSIPQCEQPLLKTRYCFSYKNQYFRLDCFDDGLKLLEIEDTNKTQKRCLPNYLEVTEDVSHLREYRNSELYSQKNHKAKTKVK